MKSLASVPCPGYDESRSEIQRSYAEFRNILMHAQKFAKHGKHNMAAIYAELAALYAQHHHGGLFASPELERILLDIGRTIVPIGTPRRAGSSRPREPKKILHVATVVGSVGGLSRMIWRWIEQDAERCHSLALTRQVRADVPRFLKNAVKTSGGKLFRLNETVGSVVSWAKRLRSIAADADLVVLHTHNQDVTPIIAFANQDLSPPVMRVDHADHLFWLGVGIADIAVSLRQSGMRLAEQRRGIATERNVLLPIIVDPARRVLSRAEAKRKLGISEDSIMLLSVARGVKYRNFGGVSYADAHVPALQHNENAILVVIGAGTRDDWSAAVRLTNGRIIAHAEVEDAAIYREAADIYVDSFPFVSNTSLLEAGSYALPLVSYFPHSAASAILGADTPGLTGNLIRPPTLEAYTAVLSRLIDDEQYRLSVGEATKLTITETNMAHHWQSRLNEIYELAAVVPKVRIPSTVMDKALFGEPDIFISDIYGGTYPFSYLVRFQLRIMPTFDRLKHYLSLLRSEEIRQFGGIEPLHLLPEWLLCRSRWLWGSSIFGNDGLRKC